MERVDTDYLDWPEAVRLIKRLKTDQDYKMCLIVTFGCFFGLKIGEMLSLRWNQILDKDVFTIESESVGRRKHYRKREIAVVPEVRQLIGTVYRNMEAADTGEFIFLNPKTHTLYTTQNINQLIKTLGQRYQLSVKKPVTHTFRKTFGRHYWETDGYSSKSLTQLKEFFGHDRVADTIDYLGIRPEEIKKANERFLL